MRMRADLDNPATARHLLAFLLLALLTVRIAGLFLARTELYFDEAQYWAWAQEMDFGYFTKPPLLAWIIAAITKICGDAEPCVRLASPFLHTLTAFLVYALAARLYNTRIAFWSALVYATLPGISFSSTVISTDAPLLLCFTGAMLAFHHHIERPRLLTGLLLGLCLGLGLNAKYAMGYFFLCAGIYLLLAPHARFILGRVSTWLALPPAAALIAPNILWNLHHDFATMQHVAGNAGWRGGIHVNKVLEFIASQFAVLGPVVFAIFLAGLIRKEKTEKPQADIFLLCFSAPVLILISFQGLLSQALANWAAVAFPAVVLLATALLSRWPRLFGFSLGLHSAAAALVILGAIYAPFLRMSSGELAFKRMLGWRELAASIESAARKEKLSVIAIDGRPLSAEMFYYLRNANLEISGAKLRNAPPADHFQMKHPWVYGDSAALLVTPQEQTVFGIPKNFARKIGTLSERPFLSRQPYNLYVVKEAPGP